MDSIQTTLKDINAVMGVTGSFVCSPDGSIVAEAMPGGYQAEKLASATSTIRQVFEALETSGQRVAELDLLFGQGRLIVKSLRGGMLAILCNRNINLPLLNLTVNVAVKKITSAFKTAKGASAAVAPGPQARPLSTETPVAPAAPLVSSPLFEELVAEAQQLLAGGRRQRIDLQVLDSLGIWQSLSRSRALLKPLEKREIIFAGRAAQSGAIALLFEQFGFEANQRFNAFYGSRHLQFTHQVRDLTAEVHLDAFSMYHRLDLGGYLSQDQFALPVTALLLTRLQMVEVDDSVLRDESALLLEHDLSVGPEQGKIDAAAITRLCAEDWGWFKTVTLNLERLSAFAGNALGSADKTVVLERAQRLQHSIASAPKGLRWQARARLGESMRWYETPLVWNPSARPDMAMG